MTTARRGAVPTRELRRSLRAALEEQRTFRINQLAQLHGMTGGEIADQLRVGARFALTQIEAALQRIDAGCYGACLHCGEQIAIERLEILPMAENCVRCQRQLQDASGST